MATKKEKAKKPLYINGKYVVTSDKPLHPVSHKKGTSPYKLTQKKIRVTLVKSTIACLKKQQDTVEALGLHKINQSKVFNDNDAIRGMLFRVRHLVKVEEI